ncbi:MAG: hypothetical protein EA411_00900, partial [Saprospirales bacterium]
MRCSAQIKVKKVNQMIKSSIFINKQTTLALLIPGLIFMVAVFSGCGEEETKETTERDTTPEITLEQYCLEQPPLIGTFRDV